MAARIWRIAFLALVGFYLLLSCAVIASAHDWYDPWCCNTNDCAPERPGQVTEGPGGYGVRLGDRRVLVPFGDTRIKDSKDGRFHVCELPQGQVRCLYVPMRSF